MKRTGKLTAITVILVAAFTLMAPLTNASAGTKPERNEMLELHNLVRHDDGERALSLDRRIARYAKRHSKDMAEKGYLFHTPSLANVLDRRHWSIAGENVGVGPDITSLQTAFMDSPDHRRNILRDSYRDAGVGVYVDDNGLVWVTVIFYG